ncbi:unnamed protein product, partial [Heterotrigona itama]
VRQIPRGNQYLESYVFRHVSRATPVEKPPWTSCLGAAGWRGMHGVTGILGAVTCHIHPCNTSTHHYSYRGSLHATDSEREFGRALPASLGMKIHDNRID